MDDIFNPNLKDLASKFNNIFYWRDIEAYTRYERPIKNLLDIIIQQDKALKFLNDRIEILSKLLGE